MFYYENDWKSQKTIIVANRHSALLARCHRMFPAFFMLMRSRICKERKTKRLLYFLVLRSKSFHSWGKHIEKSLFHKTDKSKRLHFILFNILLWDDCAIFSSTHRRKAFSGFYFFSVSCITEWILLICLLLLLKVLLTDHYLPLSFSHPEYYIRAIYTSDVGECLKHSQWKTAG